MAEFAIKGPGPWVTLAGPYEHPVGDAAPPTRLQATPSSSLPSGPCRDQEAGLCPWAPRNPVLGYRGRVRGRCSDPVHRPREHYCMGGKTLRSGQWARKQQNGAGSSMESGIPSLQGIFYKVKTVLLEVCRLLPVGTEPCVGGKGCPQEVCFPGGTSRHPCLYLPVPFRLWAPRTCKPLHPKSRGWGSAFEAG